MDMALKNILEEKKPVIMQKWFDAIIATYPVDTSGFLKKQKDQFANPVGFTITQGIERVFTALLQENKTTAMEPFLTDIIKVRAVQNFTPSQAVDFIFFLKRIIKEELGKALENQQVSNEFAVFESKIDELALSSFDIYSECRGKLYELKNMELKNMTYRLLKQANLVSELPMEESDSQEINVNTKRKEVVK